MRCGGEALSVADPWANFSVGIHVRRDGFQGARVTLIILLLPPSSGICESSLPGP